MLVFSDATVIRNVKSHLMKSAFAIVTALIFLCSCNKNPDSNSIDCSGPAKTFTTDVNPVIQSSCATSAACHGAGSNSGPGALLNYSQVFNARSDIRSVVASGHMPPDKVLSISEKSAIVCWIDNGAMDN